MYFTLIKTKLSIELNHPLWGFYWKYLFVISCTLTDKQTLILNSFKKQSKKQKKQKQNNTKQKQNKTKQKQKNFISSMFKLVSMR